MKYDDDDHDGDDDDDHDGDDDGDDDDHHGCFIAYIHHR